MVICIVFLGIFGCFWVKFKNYRKEVFDRLPQKGNELKSLYPVAYGIVVMLEKRGISLTRSWRKRQLESLNVVRNDKESEIIFNVRRVSLAIFVAVMAAVLGLLYGFANSEGQILDKYAVKRPGYGQMETEYDLTANGNELVFKLGPRQYSKEETFKNFELVYEELLRVILGENESFEAVKSDLNLVTVLDKYPFSISWMTSNPKVVDIYGCVFNENFDNEMVNEVVLTVTIKYLEYEYSNEIYISVVAPDLSAKERLIKDIKREIARNDTETITEEFLILPEEVDGEMIFYEEKKEDYAPVLFLLGIVAAIAILPGTDKDLEGQVKARNKQMLLDYSEVVSKLNILIGAGMSTLKAWEKIVRDYERKLERNKEQKRFVYEEMRITFHEIQSGISESNAYSNFGKRCNIHEYLKLGALLEQNVRKGAKGLGKMLEAEAAQAFEERKNMAKKLGEEAGTKLLVPMIIMLAIVMIIVLIPAFTSFGI